MNNIDCFFIGHNEMDFKIYEEHVESMGKNTGAYRDLNLNFIKHNNVPYTMTDILNYNIESNDDKVSTTNIFNATIAYLGTFIKRRGFNFEFINTFKDYKEGLREKLEQNNIMAIVIPTTLYVSVTPILEIIKFIKQYNTEAKIIIGGPFIATQSKVQDAETLTYLYEMIGADFYINSSQGEQALTNILKSLKENLEFDDIPNIVYKKNDKYVFNEIILERNTLGNNLVDWKMFEKDVKSTVSLRTSISCAFSCAFCGFPEHAGKYQCVDVDKISYELDALNEFNTIKTVNFIDDTFNIPPDRFKNLLRMMIDKKYNFKWNSFLRCQFIDEEAVELIKKSGCEGVFLGIESGNQNILNNMNKRSTLEKYYKGMELLKKYDILTYQSFIIGFPGETRESVQDTIDFIESTKPDFYRTQIWYCDPFTPIWEEKEKYGIKNSQFEWEHNTMTAVEAADIMEEIFLNIKNSIWLPQNNFDYPSLFQMLNKGYSVKEIKDIICKFNGAIKQKIINKKNDNVDDITFNELINMVNKRNNLESDKNTYLDCDFDF